MRLPVCWGIRPPAWWQALIVVTYLTGLRRRTLFEMPTSAIDWEASCLRLEARLFKSRHGQTVHLAPAALEHLRRIRTDRDLVFPWPHARRHFHSRFHHLQNLAAIPRKKHFGLHDLRKTHGTLLWEVSPEAAQVGLGHQSPIITRQHYVAGSGMMARALDELPIPDAFKRVDGNPN